MPLQIVRNDITKMEVDAIVNAANESLLGGGGVDGCIHRAAGPGLLAECRTLGGCRPGEAKRTAAYDLPCRYVIHTVGPRWQDGAHGEQTTLIACCRNSLTLAVEAGCESVAFPLISAGVFGYPKEQAMKTIVGAVSEFLRENDLNVFLVIYDKKDFRIDAGLRQALEERINGIRKVPSLGSAAMPARHGPGRSRKETTGRSMLRVPAMEDCKSCSLHEVLDQLDESFSEMLLRKIDASGMTDAQCYKKANIDRRLFSKIRSEKLYRPSKTTAVAFALALELSLQETKELLGKAGFALSHSHKFDIIVEYFIEHGNYNVFEINEALFAFDQPLIG